MSLTWYIGGLRALLECLEIIVAPVVETGTTALASAVFTSNVNPSQFLPGMTIFNDESSGFPAGTKVVSVIDNLVTMDQNAAGASTQIITGLIIPPAFGPVTATPLTGAVPQAPDADFAQFTASTLAGVVPQVLTLEEIALAGNDGMLIAAACISWQPTDSLGSETITGVLYTTPGAPDPVVMASEILAVPKVLSTPDDILKIIPVLSQTFLPGVQGLVQL